MTDDEREVVQEVIEKEGFDYAFDGATDFEEHHTVVDPRFHELKESYLAAKYELHEYIYVKEE